LHGENYEYNLFITPTKLAKSDYGIYINGNCGSKHISLLPVNKMFESFKEAAFAFKFHVDLSFV
jgi:hypothetical protein